jgi:hypothetical protein
MRYGSCGATRPDPEPKLTNLEQSTAVPRSSELTPPPSFASVEGRKTLLAGGHGRDSRLDRQITPKLRWMRQRHHALRKARRA